MNSCQEHCLLSNYEFNSSAKLRKSLDFCTRCDMDVNALQYLTTCFQSPITVNVSKYTETHKLLKKNRRQKFMSRIYASQHVRTCTHQQK